MIRDPSPVGAQLPPTFRGFWQSRSLALSSEDVKQELVSIPESRVPDSWLSCRSQWKPWR